MKHQFDSSARMKSLRTGLLVALFVGAGMITASATMVSLSIDTLVKNSEAIVRGVVKETTAQWNSDRTQIVTRAVIEVTDTYSGIVTEQTITVEYPGGEVDGLGMRVSDGVEMSAGEEIIIFLQAGTDGGTIGPQVYSVFGSSQGKYSIGDDGMVKTGGYSLFNVGGEVYHEVSEANLINAIKKAIQ